MCFAESIEKFSRLTLEDPNIVIIRVHGGSYSMWSTTFLEITNQYVYVFWSAEGLWKAEDNVQILYPWALRPKIILTFQNETFTYFHATS